MLQVQQDPAPGIRTVSVDNFVGNHRIAFANARHDTLSLGLLKSRAQNFSIKSNTWMHVEGL
jgi:hypothetical protein